MAHGGAVRKRRVEGGRDWQNSPARRAWRSRRSCRIFSSSSLERASSSSSRRSFSCSTDRRKLDTSSDMVWGFSQVLVPVIFAGPPLNRRHDTRHNANGGSIGSSSPCQHTHTHIRIHAHPAVPGCLLEGFESRQTGFLVVGSELISSKTTTRVLSTLSTI